MTEYDSTNRGSIWKNDRKESDKHPDFTGSLNVNGAEYYVSAWKRKEGASPKAPALSFSIKRKEADAKPAKGNGGSARLNDDMDGDLIPFAPETRG